MFTARDRRSARVRQALKRVGDQVGGAAPDEVALAWLLMHPARIVPVLGTGRPDRLRRAVGAQSLTLTRQQWFTIWCASTGEDVP